MGGGAQNRPSSYSFIALPKATSAGSLVCPFSGSMVYIHSSFTRWGHPSRGRSWYTAKESKDLELALLRDQVKVLHYGEQSSVFKIKGQPNGKSLRASTNGKNENPDGAEAGKSGLRPVPGPPLSSGHILNSQSQKSTHSIKSLSL